MTQPIAPSPEVQAILIDVYRGNAAAGNVCEGLIDIDEGFQEWRYRHVKMVERTIGSQDRQRRLVRRVVPGDDHQAFLPRPMGHPVAPVAPRPANMDGTIDRRHTWITTDTDTDSLDKRVRE